MTTKSDDIHPLECPECRAAISVNQMLAALRPGGVLRKYRVVTKSGLVGYVDENQINPKEMEVIPYKLPPPPPPPKGRNPGALLKGGKRSTQVPPNRRA